MPSEPTPVPLKPPDESLAKLTLFNNAVLDRFSKVSAIFESHELDPTKSPTFKKFVTEQLAMANSYFVITGAFKDFTQTEDTLNPPAATTDAMKAQGFIVSSSGKKVALDPLMVGSEAAMAAIAEGAFDDEESDTVLAPEKLKGSK